MATRRVSRISTRQLLLIAVIVFAASNSFALAAKCMPKAKTPAPGGTGSAGVGIAFSDALFPDNGSPTVTDAPIQQTTDSPTQQTTDSPDGTGSLPTQGSGGETPPTTEGSGAETPSTGSLPTQTSTEGSTAEPPSAGSLPTQSSAAGSSAETPSTSGNSTGGGGEHATFGDVTSGSGKCVIGNPDAYITTKDVNWVWTQRMSKYVPDFKNYIFDQIVTNKAKLNYCVRWDSTNKLSKADASKFEAMLTRQFKAWNEWLIGYDCWPYDAIEIKIVGWATRDASLFGWSDDSLGTIYSDEKDSDGIPQCPEACYKHKDFAANADTSGCKGEPFDMSLWPTKGQGGGAGGDWGQRVDEENMMSTLDQEQLTIVAHEIGHGFGLPDFYETTDIPNENFPVCIMRAGSSPTITPGDGWMLRRVLENIKDRYKF
ncbi:Neutral zinc metallopeptidase [Phytophthora megakarya]|uniref:Neutral zinc metallopeptidase n=1 Tax=Phytophthora megakarya TaxID=4795 RepID=A0A225VH54_9STRA|nr:Neutral zinc metallopeptidase [Phytophthora megakarya]